MNFHNILIKYWFFSGIAAVVLIAFVLPQVGVFLQEYKILDVVIVLAFLVTGLTLETASISRQLKNVKVLVAALASSLFLFPVIAYFPAALVFGAHSDSAIGTLINGVAPVTLASGTVMTAMALGNVPLSLFICVFCNFAAIATMPLILNLMLGSGNAGVNLPVLQILTGLIIKVLIPIVVGQLLRPFLKALIASYGKIFSVFNQCLVLMIILNAVSSSTGRILQTGAAIVGIFLFMVLLHTLILVINLLISRMIRLDLPSTAAFTIHTSQKTLTISYLIWAGYFAKSFPMALIPAIAYHITQMIMDTFVADYFRREITKRG